ncbi:hypothetical protein VXS05_13615 [Photobacterium toruni]|uniref:Uncharacterized protein n=1 Tax=Photobacterium toruni TaxID=1935446 RepID=A0ABU6L5C6_9GAMM|nr:hypothetical protein [Photobacterium toruni]MEC6830814.1 hypothetical protein [Photobacterium toruni]
MNNEWFSCKNTTMLTFFKQRLLAAKTNAEYDAIMAMIRFCNWEQIHDQQHENSTSEC